MSEQYQHTEYELRNDIDNISCIPYTFERYVEEVNSFIDRIIKSDIKQLHDKDKEIERLHSIIKEVKNYIKEFKEPVEVPCYEHYYKEIDEIIGDTDKQRRI